MIEPIEYSIMKHDRDVMQTVNHNMEKLIEEERRAVAREKQEQRYRSTLDFVVR